MSMSLMVDVMKLKIGNPTRKLVLLKLADNANDNGECWPSYNHIADHCEISRRSAINHINALEKVGYLRKEYRPGPKGNSSNLYYITLDGPKNKASAGGENISLGGGENISPGGENGSLGGGEISAPRTSHSFEPVNEPTTTTRVRELFDFNSFNRLNEDRLTIKVENIASNVFFNHTEPKHLSSNPVGDSQNSFDAFIDYNIKRGTEPVSIEQLTNLYTKWVQLSKPTKKGKEAQKPVAPGPRTERQQAAPPAQPEPSILTPVEITWLKQGNIPVGLRERLGDEKYTETLKEYGLER